MKAPFSPHITKNPKNSVWTVNEDPAKLDDALDNLLGKGGERLLPDELKWLAVTHKSFDQGRRGFNDRLAYLGRQIAVTEAMQSILSEAAGPLGEKTMEKDLFEGRREPFENTLLDRVDRLTHQQPDSIFDLKKMQKLAVETGISEVVRWKPRKVSLCHVTRFGTGTQYANQTTAGESQGIGYLRHHVWSAVRHRRSCRFTTWRKGCQPSCKGADIEEAQGVGVIVG